MPSGHIASLRELRKICTLHKSIRCKGVLTKENIRTKATNCNTQVMEPTIKYENCEEIYAGPSAIITAGSGQKRHFSDLGEDSVCSKIGSGHYQANQNTEFYVPPPQIECIRKQPEPKPVKRYRRGESTVLFSPPFFEVPEGRNPHTGTVTARCVSCRVMLRGHKNVSSNFIKHMKRSHPEIHRMYENYKLLRQHGFGRDINVNVLPPRKASEACEKSFLDVNTYSENMIVNPEVTGTNVTESEQNSETTENSPHSTPDLIDTTENSMDSQLHKIEAKSEINDEGPPEVNLSNKTLLAMGKMFDEKLKSFATKSELNEITKNFANQVRSHQDTPCSTTLADDDELKSMQKELAAMRERLTNSEHSKLILQRELHSLEKIVRKRKMIIRNIPVAPNQKPHEAVEQLFMERFNMPNIKLESVNIITNKNRTHGDRQILLIEAAHESDVNAIFRKSGCLRNTGIYIESQMSHISLKRKEKLMVLRREMLRRNGSLKIMVRNTQLIVRDTFFYWDDLLGLCMGNLDNPETNLVSGDDAAEELRKISNLDMKEFLNVLKNYDIR